jgi:pentapeptide repeat protein
VAVVPAALVVIALAFNASQTRRDERRQADQRLEDRAAADERRQDDLLARYIAQMSDLMLDDSLLRAGPDDDAPVVARTLTLSALGQLSPTRKAEVVRFLAEAELIEPDPERPIVRLAGSDLSHVRLAGTDFGPISFEYADLRRARFDGAIEVHEVAAAVDKRQLR